MKERYLPKAENSRDFLIIGSESGFWSMVFATAALAIIAVCAIIFIIKKLMDNRMEKRNVNKETV